MRLSMLAAVALMALPAPSLAQSGAKGAAPSSPSAERIAAARPVIDQVWPIGTYRRMMDGTMSKMMDTMMESVMGMRASDIIGTTASDDTLAEMSEKADPHFRERMKITFDVMFGEMIPLMDRIEPTVRETLVKIYARTFDVDQLKDMARFFATPSGKAYAEKSMLVFMEPEMVQGLSAFVPELTNAMPGILAKVASATSHLPPPPKRPSGDEVPNAVSK